MAREPVAARKAAPAPSESLARVENSLYLSIQAIKKKHKLERLGISFYDSQTTLNWSYNADAYFHAASTIKLAVLVGVYGEVCARAPHRGRARARAQQVREHGREAVVHAQPRLRAEPGSRQAPGPHHDACATSRTT